MAKKTQEIEAKEELQPLAKEELLEYHLARCEGNFLSKQQVRAVFQSLFRA